MRVPFFRLSPASEEIEEVVEVIRSGWLTTGKRAGEFERRFAQYIGAEHALAVNSGTAALHLGIEALGIGAGDRVVVPVHTFTATAEVIRYVGAEVLFVDVDRESFCLDVRDAERRLGVGGREQTKAIMPVHIGGHPCDMESIRDLGEEFKLKVVEDAAHALPTIYRWKTDRLLPSKIGTIGDITCFSFYANKTITTGEGGMLVTNDQEIAERVKVMRLHGIDRDVWDRYSSDKPSWYYEVVEPGYKYNMTDIAAAIGVRQLEKCDAFHRDRMRIAEYYMKNLKDIDGLRLPALRCSFEDHAWHLFIVLVEPPETGGQLSRDDFVNGLSTMGVSTSVHYIPLHFQPYYRNRYRLKAEDFPNSTWIYRRCVSLPIFPDMREDEVEYVVECIKRLMGG